jgi:hypothetical protein
MMFSLTLTLTRTRKDLDMNELDIIAPDPQRDPSQIDEFARAESSWTVDQLAAYTNVERVLPL